jgi:hypothetical protein
MNILQIQSALTKLDDNQLKQEMLSPGMAPQFLVLSEMQRRQEIRRGGQKGPPPPQTTLKDEAIAQTGAPPPPPQGIAALPEGAAAAQGVQGFAGGGPVTAGRYFVRDGVAYDLEALDPYERQQLLSGHDITAGAPGSPATLGPARSRDELLPAYFRDRVPPSETYVPPDPNSILQGGLLPPYFNNRARPDTGTLPIEENPPGNAYRQRELQVDAAGRAPYQPAMPAGTLDAQSAEAGGAPVAPSSGRSQWGLTGTGMSSRYPSTAGARNLSDEASGRPVGLPALVAARDPDAPETVPLAQARRSTGSGPVPDISSISDRDLLSYWRSFQPSQLGIRSAASSPFSLTEIEMERARRAPAGSRPVTSNRQFAGTGEEGSAPSPAPTVTAGGTTPAISAPAPEASAGLPSLRTRPAPSEVDAALAAMPKYPATRTAALIESGLGANTNHGGSFKGFLGVGDAMWKDYRDRLSLKESDRENPEAQRRIYESFTEDQRKLNPKATDGDVYTAWAMGPAAARAARAAPDSDAYATYARLTSKEQADKAFSTNPGLLQPGRTNAETLAAYRARYALAERGDTIPAGRGPDGTEIRVAPPGSGAAAVAGDSTTPLAFSVKGSDPTVGGEKGPRTYEDYLATAGSTRPDRFAGSEDEARRLFGGSAAEERKNAVNLGLMEAGLRIMGSNSPRLAGALSEGGIAGLQTYRQGLEAARKDEKEGFGARMGIAAARSRQDDTAAHIAGQLYQTDTQAATARATNATQMAGHRLTADTQLQVAGMTARSQELLQRAHQYATDNPAAKVALQYALSLPPGPDRDLALQAVGKTGQTDYYNAQAKLAVQREYETRLQAIEARYKPDPQKDFLVKPEDLTKRAATRRQEIDALNKRFAALYPDHFAGMADTDAAAPAAAVGAYDPKTRSTVRY